MSPKTVRFATALLVGFSLLLGSGCATPAASIPAPAIARPVKLALVNLSDSEWEITLATPAGRAVYHARIAARAIVDVELAAGDFVITQTALAMAAPSGSVPTLVEAEATRSFPIHFEPGETYRWRLATLLTGQTGPAP